MSVLGLDWLLKTRLLFNLIVNPKVKCALCASSFAGRIWVSIIGQVLDLIQLTVFTIEAL